MSLACFFGGDCGKQEITATIDSSSINTAVLNVLNENQMNAKQAVSTLQAISFKNVNFLCAADIQQTSTQTVQLQQSMNSNLSSNLVNAAMTNIGAQLDASVAAANSFLSSPIDTSVTTNVKNSIQNSLNTNITQSTLTAMAQKIDAQQMMSFENTTFDPCGIMIPSPNLLLQQVSADCYAKSPGGPPCKFGQSLSVTLMASQVTNAIVTAVTNNSDYSNLISNVTASSNTHSSGPIEDVGNALSGMIKAFMDAITGAGGMVAAAIAVICICCCCFCIITMLGGGAFMMTRAPAAPNVKVPMNVPIGDLK